MNIEKLKKQYEKVCSDYIKAFSKKQDLEFQFWVADLIGEVACFGDVYFFDFTDIVYDINSEQPPEKIIDWLNDGLDNPENRVNYYSYTKGFKRISDTTDLANPFK